MAPNLKSEFDPAVEALNRGARDNLPDLCAQFYGNATLGNISVNAAALRIAAENKSHEAFERMLEIAGEDAYGVTSVHSIGLGPDWDKVNEIAQGDERIATALRRYREKVDANIDEMFSLIEEKRASADTQPVPSQVHGTGFFSKFKLW